MLSYLLAVLAAVANATSSTLQRKANVSEPDERSFRFALVLDLVRRPAWLGGIAAVTVGFLLQAAALSRGQLAVVEPILVLELPFTLGLASVLLRRRLHAREWTAASLMTVGLAALLAGLQPRGGAALHVRPLTWILAGGATTLVIAVLVARAYADRDRRPTLLGVATGAAFGMTAAFMTGASEAFARSPASAFTSWPLWVMLLSGLTAMFLLQNALQSGTLVAVQPGVTLTDPLVSILWGVFVFGEGVEGGPWVAADVVGGALIVWGTLLLARSPLIHGTPGRTPAGAEPAK